MKKKKDPIGVPGKKDSTVARFSDEAYYSISGGPSFIGITPMQTLIPEPKWPRPVMHIPARLYSQPQ